MDSRFFDHIGMKKNEGKVSMCRFCKNFTGSSKKGTPACKAFPNGIPDKFWDAKVDHTTPYTGDNGITFEP